MKPVFVADTIRNRRAIRVARLYIVNHARHEKSVQVIRTPVHIGVSIAHHE